MGPATASAPSRNHGVRKLMRRAGCVGAPAFRAVGVAGDGYGIGAGHFVNAGRRNIDIA